MQVVTSRCGGQPGRLAAMGEQAFTVLVCGAVAGWGSKKAWGPIIGRIFAALTDTKGVVASSRAACCAAALTSWAPAAYPGPAAGRGGGYGRGARRAWSVPARC